MKRLRVERAKQDSFLTLHCPVDIVVLIAFWLDGRELSRLAATCSDLHDIVYSSTSLAERVYYRLIWCHQPTEVADAFFLGTPRETLKETTCTAIYKEYKRVNTWHSEQKYAHGAGMFGTKLEWCGDGTRFFKSDTYNYMITDSYDAPAQHEYQYARFFESMHPSAFRTWTIGFERCNGACLNKSYGHSFSVGYGDCCRAGVHRGSMVVLRIAKVPLTFRNTMDYPASFVFSYEWEKHNSTPPVPIANLRTWMSLQERLDPNLVVLVRCGLTSGKFKKPAGHTMYLPKSMTIRKMLGKIPFSGISVNSTPITTFDHSMTLVQLKKLTKQGGYAYLGLEAKRKK
jgi:hypothetical protein